MNFGTAFSATSCKVGASMRRDYPTSGAGSNPGETFALPGFERLAIICGDVGDRLSFSLPRVASTVSTSSSVVVKVCFLQGWEDSAAFMPGEASWWLQTGPGP